MYSNISKDIYQTIRQKIVQFELKPGDKISEQSLSKLYNVSRTPARETLLRLEEDGLVMTVPYKGTYITPLSFQRIEDIIFIRITLEQKIISEVINRISESQLEELELILHQQKEAVLAQDRHKFLMLDDEFHHFLYKIVNHESIFNILKRIAVSYTRVRYLTLYLHKLEVLYKEHCSILEGIKEKNIDQVSKLLTDHLSKIHIEKITLLENYKEYFE